jgi:hypothetical protein
VKNRRNLISYAFIVLASVLIVVVTHHLINAIYPMIGGFLALMISKRIEPDILALKSDAKALRKPAK